MKNFSQSKNKFGYIYVVTIKGFAEKAGLIRLFLKRKKEEYGAMKLEIDFLKAEAENKPPDLLTKALNGTNPDIDLLGAHIK